MTFKKISCIALLGVLALTSCAKTPDNVKNENDSSSNINEKISEMGLDVTSLEQMSENVDDYVKSINEFELDNMKFSENLEIDIPTSISTGKYIIPDKYQDNYAKIFSYYDEDFEESKAIDDGTTYPTGPTYSNEEKNLRLSIGCDGFFFYSKDFDDQKYYNESEYVKFYTAAEAKNCDEKYMLVDSSSEISVSEAVDIAQEFADDFVKAADYPNEFVVSRVMLSETEDGYFYEFDCTQKINSANILEYGASYDGSLENLIGTSCFGYICGEEISNFVIDCGYNEYEIEGEATETVDLVDATEYLSQNLAGRMNLEVERIALDYCMMYTENVQDAEEGESHREDIAPWATYCSYDVYDAQVCWVYYFDETPGAEVFAMVSCDDMSINYVDNRGA
ncbi:MAG: hypothetical protein LUI06_07910 [Ruminococcus sp.]|nr:hypothetical protein [Ruminococcus sp.]